MYCITAGDVSILLHSGMTMKQALTYNTLSAAMGIPGLIVGIFVGETTSANQWIFAIAGGIFIYVPLADMVRAWAIYIHRREQTIRQYIIAHNTSFKICQPFVAIKIHLKISHKHFEFVSWIMLIFFLLHRFQKWAMLLTRHWKRGRGPSFYRFYSFLVWW